ncbi:MAG: DUF2063 domain-containing protein [Myxococcales bacterium]|nr:MAG: DUF2063 domain-containing protein [Myxococcales bacterium]
MASDDNDLSTLLDELTEAALGPALPAAMAGRPIAVYRSLVHGALQRAVESMLPRTAARLGPRLHREIELFCSERGPQTHYIRDVAGELVDWAEQSWPGRDDLAPYLLDLARHEVASAAVAAATDGADRPAHGELAIDAPAVFIAAARVVRHGTAVHRLPDDPDDASEPAPGPFALLLYRDADLALRTLELSPAAAALLERLLAGEPLGAAIAAGAADAGVPVDDALLVGTSALLGDLAERGVLLGSAVG